MRLRSSLELAIALGRPALIAGGLTYFVQILAAQGNLECAHLVAAFVSKHPGVDAPERNELIKLMAQWSADGSVETHAIELTLDELAHRIVVESEIAYASLVAYLHGCTAIDDRRHCSASEMQ